jgi:hypothetical protein
MDKISSNTIAVFFHWNRYIKGYGTTISQPVKGQRISTVLSTIWSLKEANYFKVKGRKSQKVGKKKTSIEATENIEPGEEKVLRAP